MKTLTLKLPETLDTRLNTYARKKGLRKSEIVRLALTEYIAREDAGISGSFCDLSQDIVGSIEGPADLSSNKKYLKSYGS